MEPIKTFTKSSISYDTPTLEHAMKEQMILRLLTQMEVPYILKLRWSFQDTESMRLVTVGIQAFVREMSSLSECRNIAPVETFWPVYLNPGPSTRL